MSARARHQGIDPVSLRTQRHVPREMAEVLLALGRARLVGGGTKGRIEVWDAECRWLPENCKRALDRMPRFRGKCWRDMPRGNPECDETQALNWWLFCNGDLSAAYKGGTAEQRAARDAMLAIQATEGLEVAA